MLVSIGMPVYNRPVEMTRALNAVLAQSYQDIEIIISNNCSPNIKVDEVIKEYLHRDSRVKYYFQKNALPIYYDKSIHRRQDYNQDCFAESSGILQHSCCQSSRHLKAKENIHRKLSLKQI